MIEGLNGGTLGSGKADGWTKSRQVDGTRVDWWVDRAQKGMEPPWMTWARS